MDRTEVRHQALQFLEGPLLKGMDFSEWAHSKDFALEDYQQIATYLESMGVVIHYQTERHWA